MTVLFYQIGIFIAIQIAANFGKNSRNTAIVLISIFTILQVFMSWLLILQFITIYISYIISNNFYFNNINDKNRKTSVSKIFNMSNYGLSESNPILMDSIPSTYSFLNRLKSIKDNIEFERRGSINVNGFANPMDIYEFTISDNFLCKLYVYSYHNRNVEEVPLPFIQLMK